MVLNQKWKEMTIPYLTKYSSAISSLLCILLHVFENDFEFQILRKAFMQVYTTSSPPAPPPDTSLHFPFTILLNCPEMPTEYSLGLSSLLLRFFSPKFLFQSCFLLSCFSLPFVPIVIQPNHSGFDSSTWNFSCHCCAHITLVM